MRIVVLLLTIFFSCFATAVMSYTTMATPIGPWVAPIIVLIGLLFLKLFSYKEQSTALALIAAGGSIGGIVATACSFSYPTLYFLDPMLFSQWLHKPFYFMGILSSLALVAGLFGIVSANLFEYHLIVEQQLSFPIGQLIYKMISAGNQLKKAIELMIGFIGTMIFCILQDGLRMIPALIPRSVCLLSPISNSIFKLPALQFDLWPMLWAIGFVTGHLIALPLAIGAVLKVGFVEPMHARWFSYLSSIEFILAFCSGMVLYGALISFISLPAMLKGGIQWFAKQRTTLLRKKMTAKSDSIRIFSWLGAIGCGALFFLYFRFSLAAIVFVYSASFACAYQIAVIAGKFGIAPLGRFATFVMVPAMILFRLNVVQIVMIATFVEVSSGVVADVLFGRKMAHLLGIDRRLICMYQILGLIISSIAVGIVFWFLLHHFQLGSSELLAYKAQSRQLLINAQQFDIYVLMLGLLCSFFLTYMKVNAMLVLGGILMPLNFSIGLMFGGLLTFFVKNREEWEPFWSGIFAANSIWMLIRAVIG